MGEALDTLPKILKRNYELYGEQVAIREKDYGVWKKSTWKKVYEQVKYFASGLVALGLQPGDKVSLIGNNEPELYLSEFAVQAVGGVPVPLYPDNVPPEIEFIAKDADSVFAIVEDQEQVDKFLEIKDKLPMLKKIIYWDPTGMWLFDDPILISFQEVQELGRKQEEAHPGLFEEKIARGKGSDLAAIMYTSGTTGDPKGVVWTHSVLLDNAERYRSVLKRHLHPGAQYLTYVSPAWALEQGFGIGIGLSLPMVINFPEEPETVLENIREVAPEFLFFGPRQWEKLMSMVEAKILDANWVQRSFYRTFLSVGYKVARAKVQGKKIGIGLRLLNLLAEMLVFRPVKDKLGLTNLKVAVTGGTGISPDIFYFYHALGVELRHSYGTSETGFLTLHCDDAVRFDSVGEIFAINPEYGPPLELRISEKGEVLVKGGSFFQGYFKNPEASAKKMDSEGWYHSGDAAYFSDDGQLIFLDRLDDLRVLSTGHQFPPQYVEVRLRQSPFISDVLVLGDERKPFVGAIIDIEIETVGRWAEKRHIAYTTFTELSQMPEVRELVAQEVKKLNQNLPPESRIRRFVNLYKPLDADEGDLTRTGKLRRVFVERRYSDLIDSIYRGDSEYQVQTQVKYQDGRTGTVVAEVKILDAE